ncbi:MAG TPA: RNA polymerase sigma factor [Bacteroidales bacterium]|nr:RNA polymerase sigma factor [Bacteroidales bacterium]
MYDESEIIEGIKQKNEAIFKFFVEKWQKQIINLCYNFTHNLQDAEDLAQEVFIEVYNSINRFKGDSLLSTWLYRIAVNKSINFINRNKLQKILNFSFLFKEEDNIDDNYVIQHYDNVSESIEQKERIKILNKAISSLPSQQKIAFTLHKLQDISYKDIAEIMQLSLPAVESLIHRAKKNLQKKLIKYYESKL